MGASSVKRGEQLYNKLKELSESGELSLAKTRYDVASLMGYTRDERKKGYNWVSRMIREGVLDEQLQEFDINNKAVNNYYLTGKTLSYRAGRIKGKFYPKCQPKKEMVTRLWERGTESVATTPTKVGKAPRIIPKVSVYYGDKTVVFEQVDVEMTKELLDYLFK